MLTAASAFAALLLAATPNASPLPAAELRARVDRHLAPLAADGLVSGCLLVARGAEVLHERCAGFADAELMVPATPATRFNVGTVSEVLTRLVLARLVDEKKLALSDPVAKWLPRIPEAARMTVGHLADHRSGIPSRVTTDEQEALPRAPADIAGLVEGRTLRFAPGTRREESAAGYAVLARILELASRTPWADLLRSRVLEPAGLHATAHVTARDVVPGRAAGYLPWPRGEVRPAPPRDLSTFVGSRSVVSTARDLFLLARAVRDGKLGDAARAWISEAPRLSWWSTGHGFATFVEEEPASGHLVVFAGNLATPAVAHLRTVLPRLVAGAHLPVPRRERREAPAPVPFDLLAAVEGRYTSEARMLAVRAHRDGVLLAGDDVLVPTGERTFRSLTDGTTVIAVPGPSRIEALEWRAGDEVERMSRVP